MNKMYVQYGCGLSSPEGWINFDASPTLRIQKIPVLGSLLKSRLNAVFPKTVKYGDIVKGLPVSDNTCDGVYCSHVLEHLALNDFRQALKNTYNILKPGGIFRCVLPDLEHIARAYVNELDKNDADASIRFMDNNSLLGTKNRTKGFKGLMVAYYGNANHLWMWDRLSLAKELKNAGFKEIRLAQFNDSKEENFKLVESKERFENALAFECVK